MDAPRILIALEPRLYAEGLAFSLGEHRPRAEVTILDPSEGVEAAALRVRPHLVVAHRVPPEARGASFWVEVARLVGGEPVGAEISADGYSRSVADVGTGDVIAALDRAEEELLGLAQDGRGS
jgi:hypothetical protein